MLGSVIENEVIYFADKPAYERGLKRAASCAKRSVRKNGPFSWIKELCSTLSTFVRARQYSSEYIVIFSKYRRSDLAIV